MSHESEDLLEQALRQDLPSSEAQTRLRRRLLAAGVAVGQGVATTTAAAAGSAATSAGIVAKAAGLSWGMKAGLVAVVAIPSVGLWLERPAPSSSVPPRVAVSSVAPTQAPGRVAPPELRARTEPPPLEAAAPAVAPAVVQRERATPEKVGAVREPAAQAPSPSQSEFAPAPEAPTRAPEVGSTLADETRLLDAVFAELTAGNRARAAQLIGEHESRYPQGLLQRERQRARVRLSELSRGE